MQRLLNKINIEKVDDINIILTGVIQANLLENKTSELKSKAPKDNTQDDTFFQREAEAQVLQAFIKIGMKKADIQQDDILGQPHFKKYEKEGKDLHLEILLATKPVIDTNVNYMDVAPSFQMPKANPKTVESKLSLLAKQQAPYTPIEKPRAAQNGDFIDIDFDGHLNGRALASASEEHYKLRVGSKSFLPGFEEQMIGMHVNERKVINITFPQDYKAKELAGKKTTFNVLLHEIREQIPLNVNDDLAQKVLKEGKATLATLKEKMAEQIVAQAFSNTYATTLKPKIIKGLLSKFDFTLPNNVVEEEIDAKVNEKAQAMSKEEQLAYKKDDTKFTALRDSLREEAKDSIKAALIVDALGKKENITVSEEEIISTLKYQALKQGQNADDFVEYYQENNLMTSVRVGLIEDKLFSKILGLDSK